MHKLHAFALAGVAAVAALAGSAQAEIAKTTAGDNALHLIYAPDTGNLTVSVNGNPYGTVTLSATSSVFTDGVFGTSPLFYSDDNGDGTSFFFGVLVGQQTTDVLLPGVLDKNQTEASLLSAISVVGVTNGPPPARITFSGGLTAVPEPASLAALAGVGGVLLRRRRTA